MTIYNIAFKNIKGNLNKYIMYYLSNVIVVTIFFVFANFIFSANSGNTNIDDKTMHEVASRLMYVCDIVIAVFTLVFSNYSITNFLKSREKEFGLLAMFGLTRNQIRKYVMIENLIITIVSVLTGIIFGILFSKLFFMAVSSILDLNLQITFAVSYGAIKVTVLSFLILLNFISFITSFKIKNNNIANLLKGERVPKQIPKFSRIKAIFSILLIVLGYVVGINSKTAIVYTMFPILIIVIIGTKLLFSQFSVFLTSRLQKTKRVYYKGINLITLSQIIYKLKDNAKVLFITAILSGITIASAVSVYSLQKLTLASLEENSPQDIGIMERGINSHKVLPYGKVEEILDKDKFKIDYKTKVQLIKGKNNDIVKKDNKSKKNPYDVNINKVNFNVMSQNTFNNLAKEYDRDSLDIKDNEGVIYSVDFINGMANLKMELPFKNQKNLNLNVSGKVKSFKILDNIKGGIINADEKLTNTLIISNSQFKKLWSALNDSDKYIYYGYNINHSLKASKTVEKMQSFVTKNQKQNFNERITSAAGMMKFLSVVLFIGTFIAIIFFIATGSILYFKTFNEIQKDKQDFVALKKIGATKREIKKVVKVQTFIMFFLPLTVAVLHAIFAVKSVGLLHLKYFAFIGGIYIILQIIYYLFAKWMYMKQINNWSME